MTIEISGGGFGTGIASTRNLKFPCCHVFNSAVQTTTSGVYFPVSWDSEVFDNDNMHDNVVNNSLITIRTPGIYQVIHQLVFNAPGAGSRSTLILKNSVTDIGVRGYTVAGTLNVAITSAIILNFVAGDNISVFALQDSGINVDIGAGIFSYFSANFISK